MNVTTCDRCRGKIPFRVGHQIFLRLNAELLDFCSVDCLARWVMDQHAAGHEPGAKELDKALGELSP